MPCKGGIEGSVRGLSVGANRRSTVLELEHQEEDAVLDCVVPVTGTVPIPAETSPGLALHRGILDQRRCG